jgi:hypothetical protein
MVSSLAALAMIASVSSSFAQDLITPKAGYSMTSNHAIAVQNIFDKPTEFKLFVMTSDMTVNLGLEGSPLKQYEDESKYDFRVVRQGGNDVDEDPSIIRLMPNQRALMRLEFSDVKEDLLICLGVKRQKDGNKIIEYTVSQTFKCEELRLRAGVNDAPWKERHEESKEKLSEQETKQKTLKKLK